MCVQQVVVQAGRVLCSRDTVQSCPSLWYIQVSVTVMTLRQQANECWSTSLLLWSLEDKAYLMKCRLSEFYIVLTMHLFIILQMKPIWCTIFSAYFVNFIYSLYMFHTSPGPSSGGITVFIRHLVFCYSRIVWCAGAYAPAHDS